MTDEPQAPESASTPERANGYESDLLLSVEQMRRREGRVLVDGEPEVLAEYEPIGETAEGTAHVATIDESEYKESGDRVTSEELQSDLGVAEASKRPAFILSYVDGVVVGWDTCGSCLRHIRTCVCINGPAQPSYVAEWRNKPVVPYAPRAAVVTADPDDVAAKVSEVLGEKSGRKTRSDKGKVRGRRKDAPATPESVTEAAGELADAMSTALEEQK